MSSSKHKEDLAKLTLEELEELYERQQNVLKNKKIINNLPDKGKQVEEKLAKVKKELDLRQALEDIEGDLKNLDINCQKMGSNNKHVQYVCSMEKSPGKERYKPCSTYAKEDSKVKSQQKPTQLISLAESINLLVEQSNSLPVPDLHERVEGKENDFEEKEEPPELEQM